MNRDDLFASLSHYPKPNAKGEAGSLQEQEGASFEYAMWWNDKAERWVSASKDLVAYKKPEHIKDKTDRKNDVSLRDKFKGG